MKTYESNEYDVIVVGAGHAGVEAALASARMGEKTLLLTINLDMVAFMPCNPSVGGPAKGTVVREIDALGGEMGKNIDATYIQMRMLNTGKGPAVRALRAQADKWQYHERMKDTIENEPNLTLRQAVADELIVEDGVCKGLITNTGAKYYAKSVVLTTGTAARGKIIIGELAYSSGPNNSLPSIKLPEHLEKLGFKLRRFKTGTPPRVDGNTIDYSKTQEEPGDKEPRHFSYTSKDSDYLEDQMSCYMTYTNTVTHDIIRANLDRAPMFSGVIKGVGPRYCPSIEDKVVRFADKQRHQLFIEPEGENTEEMYIQGMSSSLPEDVQIAMYRTIPGLEHCEMTRNAYAIEYDCIDATQLKISLEFKNIKGLFSAGQFNGSSGYEEAAAQGLIAGINAVKYIKGEAPIILKRSDAYIGVLIDDLVTKGTKEPYRMMTSRAEYRLLLRQDNADQRLTPLGYELGLISQERYQNFLQKQQQVTEEIKRVSNVIIAPSEAVEKLLQKYNSTPIHTGIRLSELMKRPELDYQKLAILDTERSELPFAIQEQVNIQIKYEGYIKQQLKQVEQFQKMEKKLLPEDLDYSTIKGLRIEAQQKLNAIHPISLGHASRITGVSPADLSVLLIYMEQQKART